jgi:hypothetical protein
MERDYTEEDYEWEKETGRCRFCSNLILECTCDFDEDQFYNICELYFLKNNIIDK